MQTTNVVKKGLIVGLLVFCVDTGMAMNLSVAGLFDQIDQQNSDVGSSSGSWFIYDTHHQAQEFKTTVDTLTKAAIYGDREGSPPNGLIVSIRDSLTGQDLTSVEIPADTIPENTGTWIVADFQDIHVTPGLTYYLVCRTVGGGYPGALFAWWRTPDTNYPNGSAYHSGDGGASWFTNDDDFLFQTYGQLNAPPVLQTLWGPTWGIVNVTYNFSIVVNDPDGDSIYSSWDWGDGNTTGWTGPYLPGVIIIASHAWSNKGTYGIKVKLKDTYGNEGPWSDPFQITIYGLKKMFMVGSYTNRTDVTGFVLINADNLWTIQTKPFGIKHHVTGEQIIFSDASKGLVTKRFLLGMFTVAG